MEYVVWSWGDRKVAYGKVLNQDEYIIVVKFKDSHMMILPKEGFKFNFFETEKEAEKFLGE